MSIATWSQTPARRMQSVNFSPPSAEQPTTRCSSRVGTRYVRDTANVLTTYASPFLASADAKATDVSCKLRSPAYTRYRSGSIASSVAECTVRIALIFPRAFLRDLCALAQPRCVKSWAHLAAPKLRDGLRIRHERRAATRKRRWPSERRASKPLIT